MVFDRARYTAATIAILLLPVLALAQSQAKGVVVDQTGLPLPGVRLEIHRGDRVVDTVTSGADGTFTLPPAQAGDIVQVTLDGFETTSVPVANATRIVMGLAHATEVTEVVASALTSSGAAMERLGSTMTAPLAQKLPAPRPRILQSVTLLPSVVRGRDGLLRIGGTRPHESSLWIDGFDVTDPITNTSPLDLPVESVKGMAVLRDPISATFSGVLGSLASIETRPGGDSFKGGVQGFIPRPRLSNYGLGRIEAFFPRAYASGKIGSAHFFGSAEFNFERVPVPGVTTRSGSPSAGATGVTSFGRVDVPLSDRHTLTFEGIYAPGSLKHSDLSPLRGPDTAPNVDSYDLFGGFVDRIVFGTSDLLTTRIGFVQHSMTLTAPKTGDALLTPSGWLRNWFTSVDDLGTRRSISVTWDRANVEARGSHTFSLSGDVRFRSMTATTSHNAIKVLDPDLRLVREIQFGPNGAMAAGDTIAGIGLRDRWEITRRLEFDTGLRLDWYARDRHAAPSPRFGLRYALDAAGRSTVKASIGRFVGRAPLSALSFDQFPVRTDTRFDPATGAVIQSSLLTPQIGEVSLPTAIGIAAELEHQIRPGLEAQIAIRQRKSSELTTVSVPMGSGPLVLASTGAATYRELQFSVHQTWRDDAQLFVSYVRAYSRGNMNDFGTLFTNLDAPLLQPDATAPLPVDVPHRLRGWATVGLPRAIVVSPAIEWRTGFPYTAQTAAREYAEAPNLSRFPNYFSVDVTAFKTFEIKQKKMDLGLQFFNLTSHFNPRDVISVDASPRFGEFTNSFALTLGGYMQIRW